MEKLKSIKKKNSIFICIIFSISILFTLPSVLAVSCSTKPYLVLEKIQEGQEEKIIFFLTELQEGSYFEYWVEDAFGQTIKPKKKSNTNTQKIIRLTSKKDFKVFNLHTTVYQGLCVYDLSKEVIVKGSAANTQQDKQEENPRSNIMFQAPLTMVIGTIPWILLGLACLLSIALAIYKEDL